MGVRAGVGVVVVVGMRAGMVVVGVVRVVVGGGVGGDGVRIVGVGVYGDCHGGGGGVWGSWGWSVGVYTFFMRHS